MPPRKSGRTNASHALSQGAAAIVPVAMPPDREPYNIDALWAAIALELDEAKLVQLDRLRVGRQRLNLRELAQQLGQAGRFVVQGMAQHYLRGDDRGDRPTG